MNTEPNLKDIAACALGTIASLAAQINKGTTLADVLTPEELAFVEQLRAIIRKP